MSCPRSLACSLLVLSLLAGCSPGPDELVDEPPVFTPIPWAKHQPLLEGNSFRQYTELRSIAHLHSHWSHDACDGDPQPGGIPDEGCLQDLREGLCTTAIDVALLSDHPTHAEEAPLEDRLLNRGADELIFDADGGAIGAWLHCDEDPTLPAELAGHQVLMLPGIEDDLMPFAITKDLPGIWSQRSAENAQLIKDSGAVLWHAHVEERSFEELAPLGLHGIELYQLHSNLHPGLREEFLGLDPTSYLGEIAPFFFEREDIEVQPHPDLAMLGFFAPNDPAIEHLEALGQIQTLGISGGTDAHRNVFPTPAPDGERIDSYRRMMRWFNTRVRVEGELSPQSVRAALIAGRSHIVFESLGTPVGFDLYLQAGDGAVTEQGSETPWSEGLHLVGRSPRLDERSPRGEARPELRTVIYRATAEGRELLAEISGEDSVIDLAVPGPGVYRSETWILPLHLEPYLGSVAQDYLQDEVVWIYSGGLFVR